MPAHEFAYYGEWALVLEGWVSGGEPVSPASSEGIGQLRSQGAFARMPYWLPLLAEALMGDGQAEAARAVLDARGGLPRARRPLVAAGGHAVRAAWNRHRAAAPLRRAVGLAGEQSAGPSNRGAAPI